MEILPRGEREVALLNGPVITIRASLLYLVRVAPPLPWPGTSAKKKARVKV